MRSLKVYKTTKQDIISDRNSYTITLPTVLEVQDYEHPHDISLCGHGDDRVDVINNYLHNTVVRKFVVAPHEDASATYRLVQRSIVQSRPEGVS